MTSRTQRPTAAPGTVVLVSALLLAVGAAVGLVVSPVATPSDLAAPSGTLSAKVRTETFADSRPLPLSVSPGPETTLTVGRGGRITSQACSEGGQAVSGEAALSIDDEPVVYLATARPLWRDLAEGDSGADVRALQQELSRLGYSVAVDGKVGANTLGAARRLGKSAGMQSAAWQAVPADAFLWLPAPQATIGLCRTQVGQRLEAGAAFATLPAGASAAQVPDYPFGGSTTAREFVVDGLSIALDASGAVTAPEALAALAATPAYLSARSAASAGGADGAGTSGSPGTSQAVTVPGEVRLVDAVEALVVPPAALYAISGDDACIVHRGTAYGVRILGSQLGTTFVTKPDGAPTRVDLRPKDAPRCR